MSLILVIGGYGGFGARLSRRLAAEGHSLIVGGRSQAKASAFCAGLADARPLVMDRRRGVAEVLERERPDLVIDAAGPFQSSGYEVPQACIAAGVPYLDLADASDFVEGIRTLDEPARAAGVAVIAGASSVPALTGAVARKLAAGMDAVLDIDIALSAANGATGTASVMRAILSYVGRPVRLWRGRRWTDGWGWQELRREDFRLSDGRALPGRLVALADVPDCRLLPPLLPGRPAVTFRAGTEIGLHMRLLNLASWPVRWGWLGRLDRFTGWLLPLYRLTARVGGKRSAMRVSVAGSIGGDAVERTWTIIADEGHGAEIPTLAAVLLAGDILDGRCAPGARSPEDMLAFERFKAAVERLAVAQEIAERRLPPPLYERILGARWRHLPAAVRTLHCFHRDAGADGEGRVWLGSGMLAKGLARMMRMPPEGSWPLHVAFAERNGVERWTRAFGPHRFASELSEDRGRLVERFGPIRFHFDLPADDQGLEMKLVGWSVFRVPLPLFLGPRIAAREWEEEGSFRFDVAVTMPLIGKIVRYSGWLTPAIIAAA